MEQLRQAILVLIGEVYNKCYIGNLKITKLDPIGYDVSLGLDCDERPLHIAASLEWEDFLIYFKEELRKARLTSSNYYTGYQSFNNERQYPIDHSCNVIQ